MCHERWVRQSEEAVQRAWLRDLTRRDAEDEATARPLDPAVVDDTAVVREPMTAASER